MIKLTELNFKKEVRNIDKMEGIESINVTLFTGYNSTIGNFEANDNDLSSYIDISVLTLDNEYVCIYESDFLKAGDKATLKKFNSICNKINKWNEFTEYKIKTKITTI